MTIPQVRHDAGMGTRGSHPAGLYVLFFTELAERYSFYTLMGLLTLYMDEVLRLPETTSAQVYGGFVGAVYLVPLLGGIIGDRWLGCYRTVLVGSVLMTAGQLLVASSGVGPFFGGLALLACGTGLLKPNIWAMVGRLYHDRPQLRDAGCNIFYMGVNIGAAAGPVAASWFRHRYGWPAAFLSAAVAMVVAASIFIAFRQHLAAGVRRERVADTEACPLKPAPDERARILALLVVFAVVMVFWLAFYQNGYALTLWARDNTATTVSPEVFQAVDPLGIILFSLPLVALWSALRRRHVEPSTVGKITIGMLLTSATFGIMTVAALAGGDTGRVSPGWLVSAYLLIAVGEICLSPMGLSLVTKVAPRRFAATMVGGWFAAASIGGYLAGFLGTYWGAMPHSRFFLVIAGLSLVAAVVLTAVRRWLSPVFTAAGAA